MELALPAVVRQDTWFQFVVHILKIGPPNFSSGRGHSPEGVPVIWNNIGPNIAERQLEKLFQLRYLHPCIQPEINE